MRNEMAPPKLDIDRCEDIPTLIAWYDDADDTAESVKANIEARDLGDISDDEWFYRAADKFSHCKVAMKRIEKRLYRLSFDGRLGVENASVSDMREARREIHTLKTRMNICEKQAGVRQ